MASRDVSMHPAVVRQYLLGALDAESSEAFERSILTDDALSDRVRDVIDELAEQHDRHELPSTEIAQLKRLESSAIWKERMQLVESLRRIAAARAASLGADAAGHAGTNVVSLMDVLRHRSGFARLTAVAAVILVAIGWPLWFLQVREEGSQQRQLARDLSEARVALATTRTALAVAQQQSSRLQDAVDNQRTATFALYTSTRGEGGGMRALRLPESAAFVDLELAIDPGIAAPAYEVEVTRLKESAVVFSQAKVAAVDSAATRIPRVRVPARLLDAGEYRLSIWTAGARGTAAPLGVFSFSIRR